MRTYTKHNPELAKEYRNLEKRIGHTIKADLSMDQIIAAAGEPAYEQQVLFERTEDESPSIPDWNA